jgi:uncharacterized protein involved in outer membrane biogenesis
MSRRRKWLLWPVVALAAIALVVLLLFDWNWLKEPIEDRVSAELGREVEIAGDLDVDLSLHPRITVTDVRLANPPWASDEPMLALARAEAVLDLRALIDGEVRLPEVSITEPVLRLETRPDGPPNWEFPTEEPAGEPTVPHIGRLRIADAAVHYLDHGSGQSVDAALTEVTGSTDSPDAGMQLAATGTVQGEPLDLQLSGPPAAQLERTNEPYPLALDLKLGESDLAGEIELGLGKEVPTISARLRSDQVKTTDLAWLTGAAADQPVEEALDEALANAEQALDEVQEEQAEPTREDAPAADATADAATRTWFDFDQLPALEADVEYSIGRLEGPDLVLHEVSLEAGLHDRLPTLALSGNGTYQDQPVVLDVKAGPAEGEQQAQVPYRIDARIEAGQTQITATGGIQQPERLQGVQLDFAARSADASELLRQLGLPAPALPHLQVEGELVRDGQVWQLNEAHAQVGESEISGHLSADLSQARPFVSADLRSSRLRMADFVPVSEGGAENGEPEAAAAPAIPLIKDGDINLEALPEIDADIEIAADNVEIPEFSFDRLQVALRLRDRVAVIDTTGEGTFRDQPLSFEIHAGSDENLEDPDASYPVNVALQSGETRLTANGNVGRALSLTGLDVDATLAGPDLANLGDMLQLPLPATPPYDLAGKVTHQMEEERWNLIALRGTVGDSDVSGDVSLELSSDPPTLVANLRSKKLDFDDLGVLVGAPTDPEETASAEQRQEAEQEEADPYLLPDEPFDVPDLRAIDARVKFESESVQANVLPLERMSVELTLNDGRLTIQPLRFELADGQLESTMSFDSAENVLDGEIDMSLRSIRLNQLFSRFDVEIADIEMEQEGVGTFGGGARLKVRGNSIHELAASADGEVAVIMDGGQISALIVEAIGLDVGEALGLLITEGDTEQSTMVPIQCFIARFAVQDGVMETEALVLETTDSTITGKGQIRLGEEELALELLAHPKDPSALTASTPVRIEGAFKDPEIDLISEELQEKSLAALALGVVLPVIGAVLPFIEQGETKDSNCGRLIADTKAAVPAAAPPTQE